MQDNKKKTNKSYLPLLHLTKFTAPMDASFSKSQAKPKTSKLSQGNIRTWPCNDYHKRLKLDKTNVTHAKTNRLHAKLQKR